MVLLTQMGHYCLYTFSCGHYWPLYEEFIRLLFLHVHREASVLTNELSEESDQFLFRVFELRVSQI